MRTFVALELPVEFVGEVAAIARRLGPVVGGRLVPPENYHVTLAFLDELDEAGVRLAIEAVEAACAGSALVDVVAPELRADGLGKFGKPGNATLWLGIEPTPELMALASAVREQLRERGVAYDDKPFRPHVTLVRHARLPKGPLPSLAFPLPARAHDVTVFKSTLMPGGAVYKPLHMVELI